MTGCGETTEAAAARVHGLVSLLYAISASSLAGALLLECVMIGWHRASARTHLERARLAG